MIIKPKLETEATEKYEKHWVEDFEQIESLFLKDSPKLCVLDSETTGLHIIKDRPFMWVFSWLLPRNKRTAQLKGRSFAFNSDRDMLLKVINLTKNA